MKVRLWVLIMQASVMRVAIRAILEQTKEKNKKWRTDILDVQSRAAVKSGLGGVQGLKKKNHLWHPGKC